MKRSVWIAIGLVALLAILGAGAFTAVQLLTAQDEPEIPAGAQVFEDVYDDGSGNPVTVQTVILPAPELPTDGDSIGGVFLRQEDNSYFVGTGSTSVSIQVENGETSTAVDHSGPEIEVVVTGDTIFYEDITEVSFEASESKEQTVQQEVRQVDSPSELAQGASIAVWGERRGDRITAAVVVFAEER
ncbi:MAG: hypothetical protein DHS20C20_30370 [Ardenticatenaceae bacterium]|nr:MAG: hypothetical protein DHS20C20_30370 [Ardenticatenaceae bacterium]